MLSERVAAAAAAASSARRHDFARLKRAEGVQLIEGSIRLMGLGGGRWTLGALLGPVVDPSLSLR